MSKGERISSSDLGCRGIFQILKTGEKNVSMCTSVGYVPVACESRGCICSPPPPLMHLFFSLSLSLSLSLVHQSFFGGARVGSATGTLSRGSFSSTSVSALSSGMASLPGGPELHLFSLFCNSAKPSLSPERVVVKLKVGSSSLPGALALLCLHLFPTSSFFCIFACPLWQITCPHVWRFATC